MPTAKSVWYSRVPVGVSPRLTWTMKAVIVSMGTRGSSVKRGCWPAAMATIIVSPIARDRPRMNEAAMPE